MIYSLYYVFWFLILTYISDVTISDNKDVFDMCVTTHMHEFRYNEKQYIKMKTLPFFLPDILIYNIKNRFLPPTFLPAICQYATQLY